VLNGDYYCRIRQLSRRKNVSGFARQQHTSVLFSCE
jgi:hypothetical protein